MLFTLRYISVQSNKVKSICSLLALFLVAIGAYSQKTFRRHFIIAYDVSKPFINAEKNCPPYLKALTNLFSNKQVFGYNEAYQNNLEIEEKNGLLFFDKGRDEISFFHFNIAESEFNSLRWAAKNYNERGIVTEFKKLFLKDKKFNWSDYTGKGSVTAAQYLAAALSIQSSPTPFLNGVSMSNFVYPLVLDKMDTTKFAEEYVLIILSDFKTGSALGNTEDLNRVRDIFRVPYKIGLAPSSPVNYVKKEIDYLAAQYYKIDFFQYSFNTSTEDDLIGILSYKIKPRIGVLSPEDVSLFVNGDLSLKQNGYKSQTFVTSETKIKFTHNKNLVPAELRMKVSLPVDNGDSVLFEDVIAAIDETGSWQSLYTNDRDLMQFDSAGQSYYLPSFKINLDSIINSRDFENLKVGYEFKAKYNVTNIQGLNFIYRTERALPIGSIDYSTKATIVIMYILLPALAVIAVLFFLIVYSKPAWLSFRMNGYLDSFEKTDYTNNKGKRITPFKTWNTEKPKIDYLLIEGELKYKSSRFLLNWNSPVYLCLQDVLVPAGFELFLKEDTEDIKEFSLGTVMTIRRRKDNKLSFFVGIRQNDVIRKVTNPEPVKFRVEGTIKDSLLFVKAELRQTINYNFHIGADLGNVWVSFDPGTTGSCIAVGSATDNIILGEDRTNNKIIPSVLTFEKSEKFELNGSVIPEKIYRHGTVAAALYPNPRRYKGFQSIKKLLGFKDSKEIVFDNGNSLNLTGKLLAGLLVKGLYKDVTAFFDRPGLNADEYKHNGRFHPLRAVVAIPNNFTISKIQDMMDCIDNLNQFKEIRYVYEAEAVLFYYLSNLSRLNKGEDALTSETIMVFDMGGATINATVLTATKTLVSERPKYDIDFLGKIGYGIGGDTIDYCIIRFILGFKNEFSQLAEIDIFDKKIQLADLAFQIKKEIIFNFYNNKPHLITADELRRFINNAGLGITIDYITEDSGMYQYFRKVAGKFGLFSHAAFEKTIFDNVKDAVNEVIELSANKHIDKVIFSGRSTAFPMIKETVEQQLNARDSKTKKIALGLEESKIAVAKGACWYGINKNSVRVNNLKTNASFGFRKTMSSDHANVKFYELVAMGCAFDTKNEGVDSFEGVKNITDDFAYDGDHVNFYQIMGKNADKILSEGQKHKFSKIASIKIDQVTSKVAMKVNENDEVECAVILQSNQSIFENGVVSDQEIDEANEEHYTWAVK